MYLSILPVRLVFDGLEARALRNQLGVLPARIQSYI